MHVNMDTVRSAKQFFFLYTPVDSVVEVIESKLKVCQMANSFLTRALKFWLYVLIRTYIDTRCWARRLRNGVVLRPRAPRALLRGRSVLQGRGSRVQIRAGCRLAANATAVAALRSRLAVRPPAQVRASYLPQPALATPRRVPLSKYSRPSVAGRQSHRTTIACISL